MTLPRPPSDVMHGPSSSRPGMKQRPPSCSPAQQPRTSTAEQLAALVDAARLTSGARPGDKDLAINRAATTPIVAIMASKDFAAQPPSATEIPC